MYLALTAETSFLQLVRAQENAADIVAYLSEKSWD